MFDDELIERTKTLIGNARTRNLKFACVESCTGGLLGGLLTAVSGSSEVFERGFITYSNLSKQEEMGVSWETIDAHGAVSPQTAIALANGCAKRASADISVSITGVAGPLGGTAEKPVGLVYFGLAKDGSITRSFEQNFGNLDRDAIRIAAVRYAIGLFERAVAG